jgi:hypothetical protein
MSHHQRAHDAVQRRFIKIRRDARTRDGQERAGPHGASQPSSRRQPRSQRALPTRTDASAPTATTTKDLGTPPHQFGLNPRHQANHQQDLAEAGTEGHVGEVGASQERT